MLFNDKEVYNVWEGIIKRRPRYALDKTGQTDRWTDRQGDFSNSPPPHNYLEGGIKIVHNFWISNAIWLIIKHGWDLIVTNMFRKFVEHGIKTVWVREQTKKCDREIWLLTQWHDDRLTNGQGHYYRGPILNCVALNTFRLSMHLECWLFTISSIELFPFIRYIKDL